MNYQDIIFYDFETTGKDPRTCQPIQLASIVIHGRKLEIHDKSDFTSYIQPIWDEEECKRLGLEPVNDEVLNLTGITIQELQEAPSLKTVWENFQRYVEKYSYKQGKWGAPLKAGMNIDQYDNVIVDRICGGHVRNAKKELDILADRGIIDKSIQKELKKLEPYGFGPWDSVRQEETLFYPGVSLDLRPIMWSWFENNKEIKSLSMNAMREYFGIETKGAHKADKDVLDGANLLIKFLKLHRNFSPKVKFKGSFK